MRSAIDPRCSRVVAPGLVGVAVALPRVEYGQLEPVAPLPGGRLNLCLAAAPNSLIVAGGYDFPPPDYMASAISYNASADAWSDALPSMSTNRDSFRVRDGQKPRLRGRWRVRRLPVHARFNRAPRRQQSVGRLGGARRWSLAGASGPRRRGARRRRLRGRRHRRVRECARVGRGDQRHVGASDAEHARAALLLWLRRIRRPPLRRGRLRPGRGPGERAVERRGLRRPRVASLPPPPAPRARMAAAATASALFLLGGSPARRNATSDPCDSCSPRCCALTTRATRGRRHRACRPNAWLSAAALGDSVYAVGGGLSYGRNETYRLDS